MIKKWIRNWLGIYTDFFPNEMDVRKMISQELIKVFNNEYDGQMWDGSPMNNAFTRTVDFSIDRKLSNNLPSHIDRHIQHIYTEEFLDSIIDRIKRKQLT